MRITESIITNKGLDFIRSLDYFEIVGNHYFPYPNSLNGFNEEYKITTEYHGNCEQGSAITIFKKKPNVIQRKEHAHEMLKIVEKNLGVKILDWELID